MLAIHLRSAKSVCELTSKWVTNRPMNPAQLKRQLATSKKTLKTYNTPHPPKDPPENYQPESLGHNAFVAPEFLPFAVFRPFKSPDERLGPDADKCNCYKNPEYYSYHRYSFVAIQQSALEQRRKRLEEGGLRCIYDYEETENENENEGASSSDKESPSECNGSGSSGDEGGSGDCSQSI